MKHWILLSINILWSSLILSQSVSKEQATKIAVQYIKADNCDVAPFDCMLLTRNNSIDTTCTHIISPMGKAPLYLVQRQEGWVLVASEYVTTPVLASASFGQFPDVVDMPEGFKWLLSYYEDAMQYTRDSIPNVSNEVQRIWDMAVKGTMFNDKESSSIPSSHEIDSIRFIRWNQCGNNEGEYNLNISYNKFCPTWYSSCWMHTYVGCTAVAMGIVMRNYKWPYSAFIPDTIYSQGNVSQATHLVTYNWGNMPNAIYGSTAITHVNEIAGLLRDCGYACRMKYGEEGSAASLSNAKSAFENYFHYKNLTHKSRNSYIGNWVNKLKNEIAADRPVIYAGYNSQGENGHAFILYGYTNQNQFMIHWGWGDAEANNTVYSLNNLIPFNHDPQEYCYSYYQEAIWGITPDYPDCTSYNLLPQSYLDEEHFEIYHAGTIAVPWFHVEDGYTGIIIAGEKVRIAQGFKVERGAHVIFDVNDMQCEENRELRPPMDNEKPDIHYVPLKKISSKYTSASKILRNGEVLILRDGKTYTIQGVEVK